MNSIKTSTITVHYADGSMNVIDNPNEIIEIQRLISEEEQKRIFREVIKFTDDGKIERRVQYNPNDNTQRHIDYYTNSGQVKTIIELHETGNIKKYMKYQEKPQDNESILIVEQQFDLNMAKHGFECGYYSDVNNHTKYETVWSHGKRISDTFWDKDGDLLTRFLHKNNESRNLLGTLIYHFID